MNKKNIFLLIILLTFFSCDNITSKKENYSKQATNVNHATNNNNQESLLEANALNIEAVIEDGLLILSYNGKVQKISDEGDIVGFYFSEDKHSLIIELQMFSNLVVIKLYNWKNETEEFVINEINLNTFAWGRFAEKHTEFDKDNIVSSQVQFLKWSKNSISLKMSVIPTPGADWIEDTVSISFKNTEQ